MSMQPSSLKVRIQFSFKGENHAPEAVIELDKYLLKKQSIPSFDLLLAKTNQIDTYSYLYEVMQMGDYEFLDAQGLAREFCRPDAFDLKGFEQEWKRQRVWSQLQNIAREHLAVENIDDKEALKNALLQAYQAGKKDA